MHEKPRQLRLPFNVITLPVCVEPIRTLLEARERLFKEIQVGGTAEQWNAWKKLTHAIGYLQKVG
jgi:hypothetical protein